MRRQHARLLAVVVLALALASASPAAAAEAKVAYVSGSTVYVDAGSSAGLAVGDTVQLVRAGAVLGTLKVTYVTEKRASCSFEGNLAPAVGDVVTFTPHAAAGAGAAAEGAAVAAAEAPARPSGESALRRAGIRGRLGLQFLSVRDRSGYGRDFNQPSLNVRLTGTQVGGAPVDFEIDARPRRTYVSAGNGLDSETETSNRIYGLNLAWRPGPFRLSFGRQMSPSLAPLSLFDGVLAEYASAHFGAGVFDGTQPDPATFHFASDVKEYGFFLEGHGAPTDKVRWWLNGGGASSTENGEINRDFAWLSARLGFKGFLAFLTQEADVNRGWRKEAEGSSLTNSGTFASLRWQSAKAWSVDAGYDGRRNVRLYRDLVTPVTQFDDAMRQGYWAGVEWRPGGHGLVGVHARRSTGGTAGTATSYTLDAGAIRLTRVGLDVRARGTKYDGPYVDGRLASLNVGLDATATLHVGVHGGTRKDTDTLAGGAETTVNWAGLDLDWVVGRHVLLLASYDRSSGTEEATDQAFAGVSWRF